MWTFSEKATIFNHGKGFRLQDIEGHIYQIIGNLSPGVVYWRCQFARRNGTKCSAKIKTVGDGLVVSKSGIHNHRKSRPAGNPRTNKQTNPRTAKEVVNESSRSLLKSNIDPLYNPNHFTLPGNPVTANLKPSSGSSTCGASRSLLKSNLDPLL